MTPGTQKKIGLWSCVAFAVGSMVGAGVFVLSGVAVQKAGPGALVSFGLAGLAVLCSAISFVAIARFAQPDELGYTPVGRALGHRFWGFIVSWAFYVSALICTAFVLNAFGAYMHDFFVSSVSALTWSFVAAAIMTALNIGRATNISHIEDVLVVTKVIILLLLIGFGAAHVHASAFQPFMPHGTTSAITTSGLLFIAYLGFSVVTNIASDVKKPQRTVPLAIVLSVLVVMILYVGVVVALLAFPLSSYSEASVGDVAKHLMGPIGGVLIPLAALISTLSAANSNILGSSEIMVRLAANRDVPTLAGRLWNGHPLVSVLFGAAVYSGLLASRQTHMVIALANVAAITAISIINIAAIRIMLNSRRQKIFTPLSVIGLASCIAELVLLGVRPVAIGAGIVAAGTALYAGRRVFHDPNAHRRLVYDMQKYGGPVLHALRRMETRAAQYRRFMSRRSV